MHFNQKKRAPSRGGGDRSLRERMYYVAPHPNGVKPLGNLYFDDRGINIRNEGVGSLQILEDELILAILT